VVGPAQSSFQATTTSFGQCYPTNAFPVVQGAFTMSAFGQGTADDLEIENTANLGTTTGKASVAYTFRGGVRGNGGTPYVADNPLANEMAGSLSLSITWAPQVGFPQSTTFTPTCLQELQIDPGEHGIAFPGAFEAEMEGIVYNFPGEAASGQAAILSIRSEWDPATKSIGFGISMELGVTCAELPQYPGETEFGGGFNNETYPIHGSVTVPHGQTAGRGSLPPNVTPGQSDQQGCDGSVSF
jgi:hypothetical protein